MSSKVPELTKMLDIINKLKNPDLAKQEKEKKDKEMSEQQTSQEGNIHEGEEKTMPEKQQQEIIKEGEEQTLNQQEQMVQDDKDKTPKDNALQGEDAQNDESGEPEIQQPPAAAGLEAAANADAAPAFGAAAAIDNETDDIDDSSDSSDMVTESEMSDEAGAGDNEDINYQTEGNGLAGKAINGNDYIDNSQSEEDEDSITSNSDDFDDLLPAVNPNFFDVDDNGHMVIHPHNEVNELHEASLGGAAPGELADQDGIEYVEDDIDGDGNVQGDGQINGNHGGPHLAYDFDIDMEDDEEEVEGPEDDCELDYEDLLAQYGSFGLYGQFY